jgi:hypothetical protein
MGPLIPSFEGDFIHSNGSKGCLMDSLEKARLYFKRGRPRRFELLPSAISYLLF